MPLVVHPQILAGLPSSPPDSAPAAIGDIENRRAFFSGPFHSLVRSNWPLVPSITTKTFSTKSADGTVFNLRYYESSSNSSAAYVFLHLGGLIAGSVDTFDGVVQRYVEKTGISYLAVDYRLAPEHPYPAALEDAYAGLLWLHDHASELGLDTNKIGVHGESAGGGLAAALAIYAHEREGPAIAKQIIIYPVLDDRTVTASESIAQSLTWGSADNETGWSAYLGTRRGSNDVPATAAAARLIDAKGLPPAYLEVGEVDIVRDETVAYAETLAKASVSVELHVLPGAVHAFELFAPDSDLARVANTLRVAAAKSIEL